MTAEEKRVYNKAYREAHKDHLRELNRKYGETHRDQLREYYDARHEQRNAYARAYYAKNREKILARILARRRALAKDRPKRPRKTDGFATWSALSLDEKLRPQSTAVHAEGQSWQLTIRIPMRRLAVQSFCPK